MNYNLKRVLIVNPLNTWWSFQLTMELLFRYRQDGYQVFWFNGAVKNNKKYEMNKSDYINPIFFRKPNSIIKNICLEEKIDGSFDYIKIKKRKKIELKIDDVDELRNYNYQGAPLGAIIFSGIASKLKHTRFAIQDISNELQYFFKYTTELKSKLALQIDKFKPNLLVTINDRLPGSSLSLAIARSLGIKTRVYYWGSGINKIVGYNNSLYDFDEWRSMINKNFKENVLDLSKLTKSIQDIHNLAMSPSEDSKSFLVNQKVGTSIPKNKKLVVFYAASEYEHSPLIFRKYNKFSSQYSAFEAVQQVCLKLDYQLVLKHHPIRKKSFFKFKIKYQLNDWNKINIDSKVLQLLPDSTIDTYKLLEDADINITWSSTVGKESIVREKPTVIVGDTTWLDTTWGIHAWDTSTLEKLLKSKTYSISKEALLPWFYFMQEYGEEFRFVKILNFNPIVKGTKILQPRLLLNPIYWVIVRIKNKNLN